jgi:tetratricopeptide (TPR) repeat protein
MIKPKSDPLLAPPGVNFVQEVPKPARTAYEKGMAKIREGKSAEGVSLLKEAINLFDTYFSAHIELGSELYRTGKYDEAVPILERARQINERESAVWYLFGLVMAKQQKINVAEFAFREATRLDPGNIPSHYNRALMLIELGLRGSDQAQRTADLTEAEAELARTSELSSNRMASVHLQLYRIHKHRGETGAAIRDLETYLRVDAGAKNAAAIRDEIVKLKGAKAKK